MKNTEQLEPTVFVIFGGAGDLTWRKLIPALFDLSQDRSLPAKFAIIAVDRIRLRDGSLRRRLHGGVNQFSRFGKARPAEWNQFAQHIHYQQGDFKKPSTYAALGGQCAALEKQWGTKAHRIFYMATPPAMFGEIPKYLGKAGLARDREWARIVIEKPIGYDLASALSLNAVLAASFTESQIFRIDHYLGKETVQNILAFRFANPLFEPIWNRRYVDYVTITAAVTTIGPARSETWCRTTSCSCSASWLWSQWSPSTPTRSAIRRWTCSMRSARSTPTRSPNAPCADSTAPAPSPAQRCRATARRPAWRPIRRRRRSRR
jgi:glucose-6-phosphate 1-dehydrogenase